MKLGLLGSSTDDIKAGRLGFDALELGCEAVWVIRRPVHSTERRSMRRADVRKTKA